MKKYKELLTKQCRDNVSPVASYIVNELKGTNLYFDETGNIIVSRGEGLKPCIVAHMDTVQTPNRSLEIREKKGKIYGIVNGKHHGIGADDKNGIFIALELWRQYTGSLKLIFTYGEETGCIGAGHIRSIDIEDVAYFLEFDRKNSGDIIEYCSKEFGAIVASLGSAYGYNPAAGLFTDVTTLSEKHSISAVNLSCGYYHAHTSEEYTVVSELYSAIEFGLHLLDNIPIIKYEHQSWSYWSNNRDIIDDGFIYDICDYCGQYTEVYEDITGNMCLECAELYDRSIDNYIDDENFRETSDRDY